MTADEALQRVLDRQFGLTTLEQALGTGLSRDAIKRRLANGRLQLVHRRVYRAPSAPRTFEQGALAACLAFGDDAVASHTTAARLLKLRDDDPCGFDVTVPLGRGRQPKGVRPHRSTLRRTDRARIGSTPVTTAGRTLVDLAGGSTDRDIAIGVDRALRRRLTTIERLSSYVSESRFDRRGRIDVLRRIVDDRLRHGITESELELDMIDLLREYGLPEPTRQLKSRVNGRLVRFDLAYEDPILVIELDGQTPHSEFDTWQRDHDRHNAVELAGVRTLRFTWWDVHQRRGYAAMTVAEGLGLRPASWKRT